MGWHGNAASRLQAIQASLLIICGLLSFSLLSGCGNDATFGGTVLRKLNLPGAKEPDKNEESVTITDDHPGTDVVIDGEGDPEGVLEDGSGTGTDDATARRSLTWQLPCDPDSSMGTSSTLVGFGDHPVDGGNLDLTVVGDLCEPGTLPRDVIFVVDVSDSMRGLFNLGNDPLRDGSCGRLDAVRAVAESLSDNARISFVTFDGDLEESLSDFVGPTTFLDDHASADVFCYQGANTNFQLGLAQAETLLAAARTDSAREVYFISDGESSSDATVGREEAARIRAVATLATLMLKGDDTILKEDLATEIAGVPLHVKVSDAAALADAMAGLAERELASARIILGDVEVELDISKDSFSLPKFSLSQAQWPTGWPLTIESIDSVGSVWTKTSKIIWD